jgi:hypothetical protein
MHGAAICLTARRSKLLFKRTKRKGKDSDLKDAKGSKGYRKTGWRTPGDKTSDEEAVAAAVAVSTTVIS